MKYVRSVDRRIAHPTMEQDCTMRVAACRLFSEGGAGTVIKTVLLSPIEEDKKGDR